MKKLFLPILCMYCALSVARAGAENTCEALFVEKAVSYDSRTATRIARSEFSYVLADKYITSVIRKQTGLNARIVDVETLEDGAYSQNGGTLFVARIQPQYGKGFNDEEQPISVVRIEVYEIGTGEEFILTNRGSAARPRTAGELMITDTAEGKATAVTLPFGKIKDRRGEVKTYYYYAQGRPERPPSLGDTVWSVIAKAVAR